MRELGFAIRIKDGVGFASVAFDHRKNGHIAGAVGGINHAVDRHTAVDAGHGGIHVDLRVLVAAFVDFKDEAGLDRIIDDGADLADFELQV